MSTNKIITPVNGLVPANGLGGMELIANLDALYDAFQKCKDGSDWKASVQQYEINLWDNLLKTRNELLTGTYNQKPFVIFYTWERGRKRRIKSIHISDRVVQRSLCDNVLTKLVEPKLIYDNGASRQGMGPDFTRKRIVSHLQSYYDRYHTNEGFVVQTDYKDYFGSMLHSILIEDYRRLLPWYDVFCLVRYLITVNGGYKGVGIGAQLSQNAGVFYPSPIDQYFKTVRGVKFYDAFMDDRVMVVRYLDEAKDLLEDFRQRSEKRGLILHEHKTHISKLEYGFTFLKTRFRLESDGHIRVNHDKDTFIRERRKLKKFKNLDNMTPQHALECYRSWRGTVADKPENRERVNSMDNLFLELFPGLEI